MLIGEFISWVTNMNFDPIESHLITSQMKRFFYILNKGRPRPGAPHSQDKRLYLDCMYIDFSTVFQIPVRPRWPSGKARLRGRRDPVPRHDFTEDPPCMRPAAR
ncbi:hypothetical protein AVEN_140755-1 [Araneus ventricosus]|uniref:Uncharacterized protein n=1 Tax=Araneus ventricosus TaxID=182803 RepID=A0A4Y2F4C1_ARAVE|nr:hypothetical protein AVEN_140755-1 [Araneus ventricosus]